MRPDGRPPLDMVQVYGGVPPEASTAESKAKPTSPVEAEQLDRFSPVATVIESSRCAWAPLASVTLTVKLEDPKDPGIPEIVPPAVSVKPTGMLPETIDQV